MKGFGGQSKNDLMKEEASFERNVESYLDSLDAAFKQANVEDNAD